METVRSTRLPERQDRALLALSELQGTTPAETIRRLLSGPLEAAVKILESIERPQKRDGSRADDSEAVDIVTQAPTTTTHTRGVGDAR